MSFGNEIPQFDSAAMLLAALPSAKKVKASVVVAADDLVAHQSHRGGAANSVYEEGRCRLAALSEHLERVIACIEHEGRGGIV